MGKRRERQKDLEYRHRALEYATHRMPMVIRPKTSNDAERSAQDILEDAQKYYNFLVGK